MGSGTEQECKFRVPSWRAGARLLQHAGARRIRARHLEENLLLDLAGGPLASRGEALRLRRTPQGALLTFKGPAVVEAGIKRRLEIESGIDDPEALESILQELGFAPRFRYQKYRAEYRLGRLLATLDELPVLGCFIEIEGSPARIARAAAKLGLDMARAIGQSYLGLYREARRSDPRLPADMLLT